MPIDWAKIDEIEDEELAKQYGVQWEEIDEAHPEKTEHQRRDEVLKAMQHADPKLGFARAALNVPGDVKEVAQDVWGMITNPRQTIEAAAGAAQGRVDPRVAMAVQEQAQEVAADPIEAMIQNPVDTLMTVGGTPATRALDPVSMVTGAVSKVAKPIARKMYRGSLGAPKIDPDTDWNALVERGLEEKVTVTPKGHARAAKIQERIGDDIGDLIDQADAEGRMVQSYQINKYLDEMIERARGTEDGDLVIDAVNKARMRTYDQFGNRLFLKPSELQKYKVEIGKQVYEAKSDTARRFETATKIKDVKRAGAKQEIERIVPEVGDLNSQWAELAEMEPWIRERVNAVQQMPASVQKMALETLWRPGARSKIAIGLDMIQKGDMMGAEKILNNQELRTALFLSGKMSGIIEEGGGW